MEDNKYLGSVVIPEIKKKIDAAVAPKQDTLVSGVTIRTINGQSLLGAGDIEIVDKLYSAYGNNEDGALTQKFVSEKLQALESANEAADEKVEGLETDVTALKDKSVQFNTTVSGDESTVTITKTVGPLSGTGTATAMALPVASATQAGVVNTAMFESIEDTAAQVEAILERNVLIENIPADPTQEQLTQTWKTTTGEEELINGARIYDKDNGKIWIYFKNTQTWEPADIKNPELQITNFTNTAAGVIKGSATGDGKIFAEADGTGSVLGWDALTTKVNSLETASGDYASETDLTALTARVTTAEGDIDTLETTVAGKQDTLVSGTNIKTINNTSILGSGNIDIDVPTALTVAEFNALWDAAS